MCDFKKAANNGERVPAIGYCVKDSKSKFERWEFSRHKMGENDIVIEILFAGICHSDIHSVREEWHKGIFPMVPGHEIAGRVVAVGKNVKKFKIGDLAGVGCMVNSCGECEVCKESFEQYCAKCVFTYDCADCFHGDEPTYGGYSNNIVVSEKFAICVPQNASLDKVAPLLCAGITTYSPIMFSKVKKGDKVAVAGFGGLGLMAAKYALALGAEVSIFARNKNKEHFAKELGCKALYSSPSECSENFRVIINTIPTPYDPMDYVRLLKVGGEMAIVGIPPTDVIPQIAINGLVFTAQRKVYGSIIGGIKETQEMLDFSVKHNIYPEIELISANEIDRAYDNLTSGKAKFRYVIDMSTLK